MPEFAPDRAVRVAEKTRVQVERPRRYRVLMHNDDYTTMDFVVAELRTVFKRSLGDSVRIMLKIHREGVGLCGVYSVQVAETKIALVHRDAQEAGFPLRCSMEPE
jgi:ATP-dependent Clp protease adaptor protein ClpS